MLLRVRRIGNWDYFQAWAGEECDRVRFGRFNIIYGPNGSGKSTLVRLLRAVHDAQVDADSADARLQEVELEVLSDGKLSAGSPAGSLSPLQIFDESFVHANLRSAFQAGTTVPGLFRLGPEDVKLQEEIAELTTLVPSIQERVDDIRRQNDGLAEQRKDRVENGRREMIDALNGHDSAKYDRNRYHKRHFEERLLKGGSELEEGLLSKQRRLAERGPEGLSHPVAVPTQIDLGDVVASLSRLSQMSVTGRAIESLLSDSRTAEWVQTGLEMHEPGDSCRFCENEVTADRLNLLRGHFDESLTQMQEEASLGLSAVERGSEALPGLERQWLEAVEDSTESDAEDRKRLIESVKSSFSAARQLISDAGKYVRFRLDAPYAEGRVAPTLPSASTLAISTALLDAHNAAVEQQRESIVAAVAQAVSDVEGHVVARYSDVGDLTDQLDQIGERLRVGEEYLQIQNQRLSTLQARSARGRLDGKPIAEELSARLCRLLPDRGLQVVFDAADEGSFQLLRDGEPAHALSEGERNAIALLYFLHSLDDQSQEARTGAQQDLSECIVVLDDPVSSMDEDVAAAVVGHLYERLRTHQPPEGIAANDGSAPLSTDVPPRPGQVIILTHSLAFVSHWKQLLQSQIASDNKDKKQEGNSKNSGADPSPRLRRVCIAELRPRRDSSRRKSSLLEITNALWLRSPYFRSFAVVARALSEPDDEHCVYALNAGRQVIESYTRFKLPRASDNLTEATRSLVYRSGMKDPEAIATDLRLLLNSGSHGPHDPHESMVTPAAARRVLESAIGLIAQDDPLHHQATHALVTS